MQRTSLQLTTQRAATNNLSLSFLISVEEVQTSTAAIPVGTQAATKKVYCPQNRCVHVITAEKVWLRHTATVFLTL